MDYKMLVSLAALAIVLVCVQGQDCPAQCLCRQDQAMMSCKGITAIPQQLPPGLNHFTFDQCLFEDLGQFYDSYADAVHLEVIDSGVNTIHIDAFKKLTKLSVLQLNKNRLTYVDKIVLSKLSELTELHLEGNRIEFTDEQLFELNPKLRKVDFSGNKNIELNKETFAMPEGKDKSQVEEIILEHCNFTEIPGPAFCMHSKLPKLRILDLSRNNFKTLPDFSFKHGSGLSELRLDSCHIQQIDKNSLGKLTQLQTLILSSNSISSIHENAFDDFRGTVEIIGLEYNNIKSLPRNIFNWDKIISVNVSYNPLECTCANAWIQDFQILPNNTNYNLTCASPEENKGKNAVEVLQNSEPCRSGPDPMIAVYVAIPILAILTVITIIIIIKICKLKRKETRSRNAQYSLVYKPTTEKA